MELNIRGTRSSVPAPLTPTQYKHKCIQLLGLAAKENLSAMTNADLENFLNKQTADTAKIIGGNTACVSIELESGQTLILDCGTGLYSLGQELMQGSCGQGQGEIHIFLSHLHLDRIAGLLYFAPLYVEGNQVHFYYPEENFELRLVRVQSPPYHTTSLDVVPASTFFHTVDEIRNPTDCIEIGSAKIQHSSLLHPGASYAWKITEQQYSVIYAGAGKVKPANFDNNRSMTHFFQKATILFLDAQPQTLPNNQTSGWGHSDYETAVQTAKIWEAEHLFIFNHPPNSSDFELWQAFLKVQENNPQQSKLHLAREGQRIQVGKT